MLNIYGVSTILNIREMKKAVFCSGSIQKIKKFLYEENVESKYPVTEYASIKSRVNTVEVICRKEKKTAKICNSVSLIFFLRNFFNMV